MTSLTYYQVEENKLFFAKRFGLYIGIASMMMMFAGFTSAYIVKKADAATWTTFALPIHFYLSTGMIMLSSVTMHLAFRAFKKSQLKKYKLFLMATTILGTGFIIAQITGWFRLNYEGIIMQEEISGAFLYVISGMHALHVLIGLLILLISYLGISRKLKNPIYDLTMDVSPKRKFRVELVTTYWHFVDALWLYLFIFLLYNQS